jgi:hypothetical protein
MKSITHVDIHLIATEGVLIRYAGFADCEKTGRLYVRHLIPSAKDQQRPYLWPVAVTAVGLDDPGR